MSYVYTLPLCKIGKLVYEKEKCKCKTRKKKIKNIKKKMKCSIKKKEECKSKNKICNINTNRCNNPPKTKKLKTTKKNKTLKKQIEIIKTIIPSYLPTSPSYSPTSPVYLPASPSYSPTSPPDKQKKLLVKQSKSREYSPSINRKLMSLKTITPKSYIHNCSNTDIIVENKKKIRKCVKWTGKKAKKIMLDNLLTKTPVNCDIITAPKQYLSNCWMNSFFMSWFVSDKGRKFNRWFRETMIRGITPDGKEIQKNLKKPLWLLNKMIDASLRGSHVPQDNESGLKVRYASLIDTNEIIRLVNKALPNGKIAKSRQASNPFTFYSEIYKAIKGNFMPWGKIDFGRDGKHTTSLKVNNEIKSVFKKWEKENVIPKVLFLSYYDNVSDLTKKKVIKFNNFTYKLDAVIIRNTQKHHFCACITCNGKEYGFDGESFSPMQPFEWTKKINKNEEWRFAEQHNIFFNFKQGYQLLMYYRV